MGKPRGRIPRDRGSVKEVAVMVRMSGALHARLKAQRSVRSKSMNQLILDCLYDSLPIAAANSEQPPVPTDASSVGHGEGHGDGHGDHGKAA